MDLKWIARLLDQGANVNIRSHGWTVLVWVCWKNQNESLPQLIHLLVKSGASVNETDTKGNPALSILVRFNHTPTLIHSVKELIDGGVEINKPDRRKWTVLHHLARFNQSKELLPILQLLLTHSADVNATDMGGWSVLHYLARFYKGPDLVDLFESTINYGIDLQKQDLEGWNVLHVVCRYYPISDKLFLIFKLLVENGVDLHCRTYRNMHALELMLFNPAGDFHAICLWIAKNRRSDWNKLVWNDESVFNMAKLGCRKFTEYFTKINHHHCIDHTGKSALDYLLEVRIDSSTLCLRCQSNWKHDKVLTGNSNYMFHHDKPISRIVFPVFVPSVEEKRINLRSCSIVSTEHDLRSVPEPTSWRLMAQALNHNLLTINDVEFYLSEHSHLNCHYNCRFCFIFKDIRFYLTKLTKLVGTLDDRFESESILDYGSWAERSDILAAHEFDFGIRLKHFTALVLPATGVNDARVVFTKTEAQADIFCTNYGVSSGRMLLYYKLLVEEACRRLWNVRIFHPIVSMSETCVTLTFSYRGRRTSPLKMSVDLSLVVKASDFDRSLDFELPHLPKVWSQLNVERNPTNHTSHQYLVPYRRNGKGRWKLSYFLLERNTFLHPSCLPEVSHVLRLLKFFVLIVNYMRNSNRDIQGRAIERKTIPSSYALKMCLFYYMKEICQPPWNSSDQLHHCVGVLKVYLTQGNQIKSYFDSKVVSYEVSLASKLVVAEILTKLEMMKSLRGYTKMFDEDIHL